jgi:hypothetical protein
VVLQRLAVVAVCLLALTSCTDDNRAEGDEAFVRVEPESVHPGDNIEIRGNGLVGYLDGDVVLQLRLVGGHDVALLGTFGVDPEGLMLPELVAVPTFTNAPTTASPEARRVKAGRWEIVPDDDLDRVLGVLTIEG